MPTNPWCARPRKSGSLADEAGLPPIVIRTTLVIATRARSLVWLALSDAEGSLLLRSRLGVGLASSSCSCHSLVCLLPLAAQTPQALLDAGQVDQVMQMLEQQIRSAPTADTYNLLCRAYLEPRTGMPASTPAKKLSL